MEKLKDFYDKLPKNKKIVLWISVAVIILSIISVPIRISSRKEKITTKTYLKNLKSPDKYEKRDAILAVGIVKLKEAIPILEEIMEKEPEFKELAARSIGKIDFNKLLSMLESKNKEVKFAAMDAIIGIDKENISYLLEKFPEEDTETKLKILSFMKNEKYQEKVLSLAENQKEPVEVRKKCLEILKEIGTESIETRLWGITYKDSDEGVKNLAKETIEYIRGKEKKK